MEPSGESRLPACRRCCRRGLRREGRAGVDHRHGVTHCRAGDTPPRSRLGGVRRVRGGQGNGCRRPAACKPRGCVLRRDGGTMKMATKMATSKPYRPRAGIVKALELADLLDAAQIESSDAAAMAEAEWKLLATA